MNRRASEISLLSPGTGKDERLKKSLSKRCSTVISMLAGVPHVQDRYISKAADFLGMNDPVKLCWALVRHGGVLCETLNFFRPNTISSIHAFQRSTPIQSYEEFIDANAKENVYKYIISSKEELFLKDEDLFALSEIYKDNTNCFVKAITSLERLLKRIEETKHICFLKPIDEAQALKRLSTKSTISGSLEDGINSPADEMAPKTNRDKILDEIVNTEITYVDDLETLHSFKERCSQEAILTRDEIEAIFSNIDDLLDFQRKFLVGMERAYSEDPKNPNLLDLWESNVDNFSVYDQFCSNNTRSNEKVLALSARLSNIEKPLDLSSYLIKPIQRICKYPLLIREILRNSPDEDINYQSYNEVLQFTKKIADRVNNMKRKEETLERALDITSRIDDWGGVEMELVTDVILCDSLNVLMKDSEKQMTVLLYEQIMILCKESTQMFMKKKEKPGLQVKGHVFMANLTGIQGCPANSTDYFLKIFWRESTMESLKIGFRSEDQMRVWKNELEKLWGNARKGNRRQGAAKLKSSKLKSLRSHVSLASIHANNEIKSAFGEYKNQPSESYDSEEEREDDEDEQDSEEEEDIFATKRSSIQSNPIVLNDTEIMKKLGSISQELHDFIASEQKKEAELRSFYFTKVYFNSDIFLIKFDSIPSFKALRTRVFKKISSMVIPEEQFDEQQFLSLGSFSFKFKDADNDLINLDCDEDVDLAFTYNHHHNNNKLRIFVSLIEEEEGEEE